MKVYGPLINGIDMRIDYKDKSYIEIRLGNPGKIAIILGAQSKDNPLKYITNACEVSLQDFSNLVGDIPVDLPKPEKIE
jgi:hypothetical protein